MDERPQALGAKVDAHRLQLGDGEAAVVLDETRGEELEVDACGLGELGGAGGGGSAARALSEGVCVCVLYAGGGGGGGGGGGR